MESAEGKVMLNVPVCSDVDAFTIDGLFTTLMLIWSPDVKSWVGSPPDRVASCAIELRVTAVIVTLELWMNVGLPIVAFIMLIAKRDCEQEMF